MLTRRGFLGAVAATAALSITGIAGARQQLSSLTADDIMERYPEVRDDVGYLTFGQAFILTRACGDWIKERPNYLQPKHMRNLSAFCSDYLTSHPRRRFTLRLFAAVTQSKNITAIRHFHASEVTKLIMHTVNEAETTRPGMSSEEWRDYFYLDRR